LAVADSIVIKHYTSEIFECLRLNNRIKLLKHRRRYCVMAARVCGRQSVNANFGLLSHDPWNMYPNWISSNECSDAN